MNPCGNQLQQSSFTIYQENIFDKNNFLSCRFSNFEKGDRGDRAFLKVLMGEENIEKFEDRSIPSIPFWMLKKLSAWRFSKRFFIPTKNI